MPQFVLESCTHNPENKATVRSVALFSGFRVQNCKKSTQPARARAAHSVGRRDCVGRAWLMDFENLWKIPRIL